MNFDNLFYEDTPVMARILGPTRMEVEESEPLFHSDNEEI